jgi:exodeoxyribonuclease I
MTNSFYWYDLETSGTDPKWDRIVQFAGLRTDEDLNPLDDEYSTYVHLPDDVLPNPEASLVTGITPQLTHAKGISETQALLRINALFATPNTCVAGYNSLRFDDEFTRYGLYRNLLDPYAREWQQGNSRWDLIDLVRATGALRREGIEWPVDEEGLPVYRLEELTRANGIAHGQAHDAMSDVHATVGMARLIKKHQPKLFEYYLGMRKKKAVRGLLEPYGARICVHVSALYPRTRSGVGPVMSLTRHPINGNSVLVVDLAEDIEPLLTMSAEEIGQKLFTPGSQERPPLKEVRINRCPFIAPIEVLNEENLHRLPIDLKQVKERARRLRQPGLADKVARAYAQRKNITAPDPDAALYDGFLQDDDRTRCQYLHSEMAAGRWREVDFADKRLATLARRMKARSFPNMLDAQEEADWRAFVVEKLSGEGDWLNLHRFEGKITDMAANQDSSAQDLHVLQQLAEHAADLRNRYHL